jgi:hypothetical protein
MSDPNDDRRKAEFHREQDRQHRNFLDDQEWERARRLRETEEGQKAVRRGDNTGAISGIAGPDSALYYANLSAPKAPPDPNRVSISDLPREELVRKIHEKRDDVIHTLESLEIFYNPKRRWITEFSAIDLFDRNAKKRVKDLEGEVDRYKEGFSIIRASIRMDLSHASMALSSMGTLCLFYQLNFGKQSNPA